MLLIGVRKDDGWQHARWELTYPADGEEFEEPNYDKKNR